MTDKEYRQLVEVYSQFNRVVCLLCSSIREGKGELSARVQQNTRAHWRQVRAEAHLSLARFLQRYALDATTALDRVLRTAELDDEAPGRGSGDTRPAVTTPTATGGGAALPPPSPPAPTPRLVPARAAARADGAFRRATRRKAA